MKACIQCDETKPLEKFHKHPKMTDGHINVCKSCRHDYCKNWRKENREALKIKKAQYHEKVKDDINARVRQDRKVNPSKYKESNLFYVFGMSLVDYERLSEKQNHVCAICKNPETAKHQNGKTRDLAVDHCHLTGNIRGLLCSKHNLGLGQFNDDIALLEAALEYLKKYKVGN